MIKMAYEDEFRTDGFENEHTETSDEFVGNEEFSFLEETKEFDERFFHSDEYNKEFCGGLKEKEEEDSDDEDEEAFTSSERSRERVSLITKAAEALKMGAIVATASAVVITGAPEAFGDLFIQNEIGQETHIHKEADEWETVICATCLAEGEKMLVCSDCGEKLKTETIPVLEHVPGGWIVSVPATCKDEGTEIHLCKNCESVLETRIIAAGKHLAGDWIIDFEPTCTVPGHRHKECVACGTLVFEEEITASHTEVKDPAVEANCKEKGLTEGSHCSVCGVVIVKQEEIPTTEHNIVTDSAVPGTCSNPGLTEGSHCSVCGATIVAQSVIPYAHDPVIVPGYASSCIRPGLSDSSYCRKCQQQLTEAKELPLAPHTQIVEPGQAPTCCEPGYSDMIYCSECQEIIQEAQQLPVDPDAHNWVLGTGPAEGMDYYYCSYCGMEQP